MSLNGCGHRQAASNRHLKLSFLSCWQLRLNLGQLHKVPNGLPPPRVNLVFARKAPPLPPSLLLKANPLFLLLARACPVPTLL